MPDPTHLTLERQAGGHYVLGQVGTLTPLPRFAAKIQAQDTAWSLRRAMAGFGQTIRAVDEGTGAQAALYRPDGPLHLRGIYRGTITYGERQFQWRANRQLGTRFEVGEGGTVLSRLQAGGEPRPVSVEIEDLSRLEPLVLLFCCHLVKQVSDTGRAGAAMGSASAGA